MKKAGTQTQLCDQTEVLQSEHAGGHLVNKSKKYKRRIKKDNGITASNISGQNNLKIEESFIVPETDVQPVIMNSYWLEENEKTNENKIAPTEQVEKAGVNAKIDIPREREAQKSSSLTSRKSSSSSLKANTEKISSTKGISHYRKRKRASEESCDRTSNCSESEERDKEKVVTKIDKTLFQSVEKKAKKLHSSPINSVLSFDKSYNVGKAFNKIPDSPTSSTSLRGKNQFHNVETEVIRTATSPTTSSSISSFGKSQSHQVKKKDRTCNSPINTELSLDKDRNDDREKNAKKALPLLNSSVSFDKSQFHAIEENVKSLSSPNSSVLLFGKSQSHEVKKKDKRTSSSPINTELSLDKSRNDDREKNAKKAFPSFNSLVSFDKSQFHAIEENVKSLSSPNSSVSLFGKSLLHGVEKKKKVSRSPASSMSSFDNIRSAGCENSERLRKVDETINFVIQKYSRSETEYPHTENKFFSREEVARISSDIKQPIIQLVDLFSIKDIQKTYNIQKPKSYSRKKAELLHKGNSEAEKFNNNKIPKIKLIRKGMKAVLKRYSSSSKQEKNSPSLNYSTNSHVKSILLPTCSSTPKADIANFSQEKITADKSNRPMNSDFSSKEKIHLDILNNCSNICSSPDFSLKATESPQYFSENMSNVPSRPEIINFDTSLCSAKEEPFTKAPIDSSLNISGNVLSSQENRSENSNISHLARCSPENSSTEISNPLFDLSFNPVFNIAPEKSRNTDSSPTVSSDSLKSNRQNRLIRKHSDSSTDSFNVSYNNQQIDEYSPRNSEKSKQQHATNNINVFVNSYRGRGVRPFALQITRNVRESDGARIIQLLPSIQPINERDDESRGVVVPLSLPVDMIDGRRHNRDQPDEDDLDYSESVSDYSTNQFDYEEEQEEDEMDEEELEGWPYYYEFDDCTFRILSSDAIFRKAVLSDPIRLSISKVPVESHKIHVFQKTIVNDFQNSKSDDLERLAGVNQSIQCRVENSVQPNFSINKSSESIARLATSKQILSDGVFSATRNKLDTFSFKKPILPPAKRPLSRRSLSDTGSIKSRSCSSSAHSSFSGTSHTSGLLSSSLKELCIQNPCNDKDDDVISLLACSIKSSDFERETRRDTKDLKSDAVGPEMFSQSSQFQEAALNSNPDLMSESCTELSEYPIQLQNSDMVIKWLTSSQNITREMQASTPELASTQEMIRTHELANTPETVITQEMIRSHEMANTPETVTTQDIAASQEMQSHFAQNFLRVPYVFKKICFYKLRHGICRKRDCYREHNIRLVVENKIRFLSRDDLITAYNFLKDETKCYGSVLYYFIGAFIYYKCASDLIKMPFRILRADDIVDRTPPIKHIVLGLQECMGWSLAEAIEKIMQVEEITENSGLSDILLSIICYDAKKCLLENWHLVQKLTEHRKHYLIDHHLVEELLIECSVNKNIQLCVNIMRDMIMKENVNLNDIEAKVLTEFLLLLNHLKLLNEKRELVNRMQKCMIPVPLTLIESISKPVEHVAEKSNNNINLSTTTSLGSGHSYNFCEDINNYQGDNFMNASASASSRSLMSCNFNSFNDDQRNCHKDLNMVFKDSFNQRNYESDFYQNSDVMSQNTNRDNSFDVPSNRSASHHNMTLDHISYSTDSSCPPLLDDYDDEGKFLSECDIKRLADIVAEQNIVGFLTMFNMHKNTPLINSLIINTISFFKRKDHLETYNVSLKIIDALERTGIYRDTLQAQNALYLFVANTVGLLEQKRSYRDAAQLLQKCYAHLEDLIKVKWLRSVHPHTFSHLGKYLQICCIFVKGGCHREGVELLMDSRLKLLCSSSNWNLQNHESSDESFRNKVVQGVLTFLLDNDLRLAKKLIMHIITSKDMEIDIWRFFNTLVLRMVDSAELCKNDLLSLLQNIIQAWYKHLTTPVMRGLLVWLVNARINKDDLRKFYKKCCKRKIYELRNANNHLVLKSDMKIEEIYVALDYLFDSIVKYNFLLLETTLVIELAEPTASWPKTLLPPELGTLALKKRICTVLAYCFEYAIIVETNDEPFITLTVEKMQDYINYCKNLRGPQTSHEPLCMNEVSSL